LQTVRTASMSMQVAGLPWHYDVEIGTANMLRRITANIMKGLFLFDIKCATNNSV